MKLVANVTRALRHAVSFRRADGGNIAPIFAICMVPIMGFVGAAIDYSRANKARTAMQAALDSTALMISKDASGLSATQIQQKAQAFFNALYVAPETTNVSVAAAYTAASGSTPAKVVVTGSGKINADFMKVAGYPTIDFGASSTTQWGSSYMRVALALDNTGSMASAGKMSAMQTSAKDLITKLSNMSKNNDDMYISIVPFASHVNIGKGFKNELYMDWSIWSDNGSTVQEGWQCSTYDNAWQKKMRCGNVFNNINNWNGCVTDRAQPYDTQSDAPGLVPLGAMLTADQTSYCPQAVTPLSRNWQPLKNAIDDMTPSGGTNQPIGLFWGWMTLLSQVPFNAPAKTSGIVYNDVIILLSDGLNTMDRFYGNGYDPSPQVDARQSILCDNIKATGVKIYTIQVNTDGDPESAILRSCASDGQFYPTTTASGIATAFDAISTSLTKLRVAK